jgi:hypothetical protein
LGEHLGQLLVIGWSATLSVVILRSRVLPRWLGATGLAVSALYLLNQGDVLATALPGFPVWDLAGLLGSTGWGLWIAALGVTLLLRPKSEPDTHLAGPHPTSSPASARFGDHHVRSGPSDPGDLVETPDRLGERGDQLLDLGFDRGDIRAGLVDPGRHRAQQERVVIGEAPHERLLQPRDLWAHPRPGPAANGSSSSRP